MALHIEPHFQSVTLWVAKRERLSDRIFSVYILLLFPVSPSCSSAAIISLTV